MNPRKETFVVRSFARRVPAALVCAVLLTVFGASIDNASAQAPEAPKPEAINQVEAPPTPGPRWVPNYRFRFPLRVVGDLAKQSAQSVIAKIPTGGWLRPDAGDLTIQTAGGVAIPVNVLSHDPMGDTVIQFRRSGEERWYWVYGGNPNAQQPRMDTIQEGIVAEFREWAGDKLDSWTSVLEGLKKSENVTGNAVVGEIVQNVNPTRPHSARKFAASYRGYLKITTPGVHRFFVNSDDASFLFIDGFKVAERTGQNTRITGNVPRNRFGAEIELTAGVHPIEVHHVMGNNPTASGICALLWLPPTPGAKWGYVPRSAYAQPLYAHVAGVEEASGAPIGTIGYGVEDTLNSGGVELYLTRFEAQGAFPDNTPVTWDFGDGTTGKGRSVRHVYFRNGPYKVSLKVGNAPAFQTTVTAWAAPGATSPLALPRAVKAISDSEWQKLDAARLNQLVEFLMVCGAQNRWPLMESLARFLLGKPAADQDPQFRATLYAMQMQALSELGRAREALKLTDPAYKEFEKLPSLRVTVRMAEALVYHRYLREPVEADKIYGAIIEENRRVEVPEVRDAAIRWGDMLAELGDTARAAEAYRLATSLTADRTQGNADAATRGALIRVAEQKLRAGEVRECRRLLEKMETDFPEQKLDGMYRYLRGEADRFGGRYEDAIRNYGIMAAMPQWAGYRDRATFGIADAHYRMGEFPRTLELLQQIKENHPNFYAERKLAEYQKVVEGRIARINAAKEGGANATPFFTGFTTGFEPDEKEKWIESAPFTVVSGGGMQGKHVGLLDNYPANRGYYDFAKRVKNLASDSWYWVEVWYRENLEMPAGIGAPHVHCWLYGQGNEQSPSGTGTIYFDRSYGVWRRLGFMLKTPVTQDGQVVFSIRQVNGVMEIDSLSILPVADRERDALLNFIEGAVGQ